MKYKFKSTINCGNCIASVSPFLNQRIEIEDWSVDTENENKWLRVETDLKAEEVVEIVKEAGYNAELVEVLAE